jgi:hypothetical protein
MKQARGIGIIAIQIIIAMDNSINCTDIGSERIDLIEEREDSFFMGDRHICAQAVGATEGVDAAQQVAGRSVPEFIAGGDIESIQASLLKARGE